MNANELADELSWSEMDTDEIETWTKEAATMLRQQQAEIEVLKESLRRQEFLNRKLHELDERKYSRIGKLKKKLEKAQEK